MSTCTITSAKEIGISKAKIKKLVEIEQLIKTIENEKKKAEAVAADLRAAIMKALKENNLKTFDNNQLKITYVAPYTRASLDPARLKNDRPEIYDEYQKEITVKESLKITLK